MYAQLKRAGVALGVIITVALVTGAVAARGAPAGNAATEWNTIAVDTLINLPGPAGGAPPASQVNVGMTQGAVFDAVNAIDRRYKPYLLIGAFPCDRLEGRGRRDRCVHRPRVHRLDGSREHPVPDQGRCVAVAGVALCRLARSNSQLVRQDAGDRRGERGGPGDDRREAGRRTVRAVSMDTEPGARTLAAPPRPDRADPRSNPVGRQHEAVRAAELVAVQDGGATCALVGHLGAGLQRGEGHRLGEQRRPHAHPDVHRPLVAEQPRRELERRRPAARRRLRGQPRRHGPSPRDGEPERGGRVDQLLERQVLLGLLAAVECDPESGRGRQPC